MKLRHIMLLVVLSLHTTPGNASDPADRDPVQSSRRQVERNNTLRLKAARAEYNVRISEFKAGLSPINVVLQSNERFLRASLAAGVSDAGIKYDHRASELVTFAERAFRLGSVTRQEVAQAKTARLDSLLKDLFQRRSVDE